MLLFFEANRKLMVDIIIHYWLKEIIFMRYLKNFELLFEL